MIENQSSVPLSGNKSRSAKAASSNSRPVSTAMSSVPSQGQSTLKSMPPSSSNATGRIPATPANAAAVTSVESDQEGLGWDLLDTAQETLGNMKQTWDETWFNAFDINEDDYLRTEDGTPSDRAFDILGRASGAFNTLGDRLKVDLELGATELWMETYSYGVGLFSEELGEELNNAAHNANYPYSSPEKRQEANQKEATQKPSTYVKPVPPRPTEQIRPNLTRK